MKKLSVAMITSLMIFSLTACGNEDTGVVISAGDNSNGSESSTLATESSESDTEQGKDSTELVESMEVISPTAADFTPDNILGVWITEDDINYVSFTFDNGNQFTAYYSETDTYEFGTYETDSSTYVEVTISKEVETETAEVENTSEQTDEEGTTEEVTEPEYEEIITKYDLSILTILDDNNQYVDTLTLTNGDTTYEFIKSHYIEEKTAEELEAENEVKEEEEEEVTTESIQ